MKLCKMTTISRRFFCIRCCCEGNAGFTSILTINPLIDMGLWALHNCYVYGSWDFLEHLYSYTGSTHLPGVLFYWEYSFTGSTHLLCMSTNVLGVLLYWECSYTGSALDLGVWEYSCTVRTLVQGVLLF